METDRIVPSQSLKVKKGSDTTLPFSTEPYLYVTVTSEEFLLTYT